MRPRNTVLAALALGLAVTVAAWAAKESLDTTANDTAATQRALLGASAPLDEISKLDMLQGIGSIPELAAASERALACEPLTVKETAPR